MYVSSMGDMFVMRTGVPTGLTARRRSKSNSIELIIYINFEELPFDLKEDSSAYLIFAHGILIISLINMA